MVVGDFINIMKMTFDFNFDLYKAFKHAAVDTQKRRNREKLSYKKASL